MGRYSDYLLVSDFDHTLTAADGAIPRSNLDAIDAFMRQDGRFTVATGRSIALFQTKQKLFRCNAPLILFNGAVCYDYQTDHVEFDYPLPPGAIEFTGELLQEFPELRYEIQTLKKHCVISCEESRLQVLKEHGVELIETPYNQIREPVYMICTIGKYIPPDDPARDFSTCTQEENALFLRLIDWIQTRGGGAYAPVRSTKQITEMTAGGVSKGASARKLANALGRKRLVCVGDAMNDLSMLREADAAFMPSDGDAALTKEKLTLCAPCGEGAVASVISML